MFSCPDCNHVDPIQDEGSILLRGMSSDEMKELQGRIETLKELKLNTDGVYIPFSNKDELLPLLHMLADISASETTNRIQVAVQPEGKTKRQLSFMTLQQFSQRLQNQDLIRIIHERLFTSHLQPIVLNHNGSIYGYEFVLRPLEGLSSFQPYRLFEVAKACGLHSFLDRQARISAIMTSAKLLPQGIKRFINFLPSSIYNPNYCLSHTFQAIEEYSLDPNDFVFEVVETEKIEDIQHLQSIFEVYRQHGMKVALDDVGAGFNTLDVLAKLRPDYVKIDRGIIDHCDVREENQTKIRDIVRISQSFGAVVLAEGIERSEEASTCSGLGVDLAQGYLFGKPAALPIQS